MARRNNRQAVTEAGIYAFRATNAGGSDGGQSRGMLITCHPDSDFPVEYRLASDPADEWARLEVGQAAQIIGSQRAIEAIQMRGVGGEGLGGVEETRI